MAMLIRGQDVIEDEARLRKVVALELGMTGPEYSAAKRFLQEADLIEERTTRTGKQVLNEKIERLNHAENYKRVGDLWLANNRRTVKEEAIIYTLDEVVRGPTDPRKIDPLHALKTADREAVIELGSNAGVIDFLEPNGLLYSPLLWDVSRAKLAQFLKAVDKSAFIPVVQRVRARAGTDFTASNDTIVLQAIRAGILPSYRVNSTGGERLYSFAPYTGTLLSSDEEKTVLDKARALVSCLRYGNEAATITRIRRPLLILNALMDASRGHRVGHPNLSSSMEC